MAPAKAIIKIIEKIVEPLIINIISSDKQAIKQTPAANPSKPSVKLIAFVIPIIHIKVIKFSIIC